jgi:abhydrolase domain-containing protein 12
LSNGFFEYAVKATCNISISQGEFEQEKTNRKVDMGEGGWSVEWPTSNGLIRQEVPQYGNHDRIMSHPQIAIAVMKAFQNRDPTFRE